MSTPTPAYGMIGTLIDDKLVVKLQDGTTRTYNVKQPGMQIQIIDHDAYVYSDAEIYFSSKTENVLFEAFL